MSSEAIEPLARRIRDVLTARVHEDGIWRGVVFGGDRGTANTFASLIAADLASPEGRAALLDALGMERIHLTPGLDWTGVAYRFPSEEE